MSDNFETMELKVVQTVVRSAAENFGRSRSRSRRYFQKYTK